MFLLEHWTPENNRLMLVLKYKNILKKEKREENKRKDCLQICKHHGSCNPGVVTEIIASPSGRFGESTSLTILLSPLDFRK